MKRLPLALALLLTVPATAAPTSLNAQLLKAVDQGKEAQVKALLRRGASANACNGDRVTALMLASQQSDFPIVYLLLAKGANVKVRDRRGYTVLGYTIEPDLLERFMARGARATEKDSDVLSDHLENFVWIDSDMEDKDVESYARLLVKAGVDISGQGEDSLKMTPLLNAVRSRPGMVRFLLDLGAKPNVGDSEGHTPLLALASPLFGGSLSSPQQLATAWLLLARGANVNQRDNTGATALLQAAQWGRWELVRFFISQRANVNAQDKSGFTALMHAATAGHVEMAKLLLKAGAKPDLKDKQGGTALARAQSTTLTSAQWFIAGGLNQDEEKEDLATFKRASGDYQVVEGPIVLPTASMQRLPLALALILAAPTSATPAALNAQLLQAAQQGQEAQVKVLLRRGASPNARDADGITALMLASQQGNACIVDSLLAGGANVRAHDGGGYSVLAYAEATKLLEKLVAHGARATAKDSEVLADNLEEAIWSDSNTTDKDVASYARLIAKSGADLNSRGEDEFGLTPLLNAVETRPQLVRLLLNLGAKPDVADKSGRTPLMAAIGTRWSTSPRSSQATVKLLLARGASVNRHDREGTTALLLAAQQGSVEIVRSLIARGADVNAPDKTGTTAMMLAARAGDANVARLLLQAGAKPELHNKNGETALSIAQDQTVEGSNLGTTTGFIQRYADKQRAAILSGRQAIIKLLSANH